MQACSVHSTKTEALRNNPISAACIWDIKWPRERKSQERLARWIPLAIPTGPRTRSLQRHRLHDCVSEFTWSCLVMEPCTIRSWWPTINVFMTSLTGCLFQRPSRQEMPVWKWMQNSCEFRMHVWIILTKLAWSLSSHNMPPDRARELFKPLKKQQVSKFLFKIIRALLGLNYFWCDITTGGG